MPELILLQYARSHPCINQRRFKIAGLKLRNKLIRGHLLKYEFDADCAKLTLNRQAYSLVRLIRSE